MKRKYITAVLFFISALYLSGESIRLISTSGIVQVRTSQTGNWLKAVQGQNLKTGYFIYTGFNSTAVIQTDNAKIEVKALSQASVSTLVATKENIETDIYLKYGKVKAEVEKSDDVRTVFKVRSTNSTASVRGTIFTFGEN